MWHYSIHSFIYTVNLNISITHKFNYYIIDDYYADFKNVYDTETTEQHHPTLIEVMQNSERALSTIFTNTKVHNIIQCF